MQAEKLFYETALIQAGKGDAECELQREFTVNDFFYNGSSQLSVVTQPKIIFSI